MGIIKSAIGRWMGLNESAMPSEEEIGNFIGNVIAESAKSIGKNLDLTGDGAANFLRNVTHQVFEQSGGDINAMLTEAIRGLGQEVNIETTNSIAGIGQKIKNELIHAINGLGTDGNKEARDFLHGLGNDARKEFEDIDWGNTINANLENAMSGIGNKMSEEMTDIAEGAYHSLDKVGEGLQAVLSRIGNGAFAMTGKTGLGVATGIGLSTGSYYGIKFCYQALWMYYAEPPFEILKSPGFFGRMREFIFGSSAPKLSDMIFTPDIKELVSEYQDMLYNAINNGEVRPNLILYGPPGTGKTEIAKRISRESGKTFIGASGSSFAKYPENEGVVKMDQIFAWARKKGDVIIFIDEIDALLPSRKRELNSKEKLLISNFLAHLGTASKEFSIIGATNYLEHIDDAAFQRFAMAINIPLPQLEERIRIITHYIKYHIESNHKLIIANNFLTSSYITHVAKQTEGFSGRELENICIIARQKASVTKDYTLTEQIFDRVVKAALEKHTAQHQQAIAHGKTAA